MTAASANCARISSAPTNVVKRSCRPGSSPAEAQVRCHNGAAWRLANVRDADLRKGRWHEGGSHRTEQTCVSKIDLDINIHVRKRR